ncbi:MAG TPA: branched-chain amino acid ABC transporter substrate-binding protein [Candidatus Limnocylindrales bacterium]|nr:branched-chain amino acid ABC transporter substrate-binding protein [Candidatus Limnocylindrales bacterium]
MKVTNIGALGVIALVAFSACSSTPQAGGGKTIKIGTELPMSGAETANGEPTANGVKLAIKQANAKNEVPGYTLDVNVQDDAVNGAHDPQQGATNMHTLVADASVVGVVGPFNSNVAQAEIPISNAGGLTQCSPANTNTGLTYPPDSLKYRPNNPDKINYIRLAAPDSIQGPAGADYTFNDLKAKSVYILDDTETFGVGVGNSFEDQFKKDGGTVTKRDSAPKSTTDYTPLFTAAAAAKPEAVYLAGTTPTGMGLALKQGRTVAGFENIPFVGPDGIADLGPGGTTGATITVAGAGAHDVHGTVAGIHDLPAGSTFVADYTAEYGKAPGAYSAAGYACAQVIIAGIKAAVAGGKTDNAAIREAVRAGSTAAGNKFDTVVGSISFDKNGDITTPYMSFYKTDLTAEGGKGGWVYVKQQAFTDPNAQ